jgi:putative oxidoreductase
MKFVSYQLQTIFMNLGLPYSLQLMYAVAAIELICGVLILLNKHVKKASIPLLIIIIAAILLTKVPILHTGLLTFAFNARLDITMLILLFILYNRGTSTH